MRVYFLSVVRAALKLNGIYVGIIDAFERLMELDEKDGIFAEIIPENNAQSVNFIIDEKFLSNPPDFADVYRLDGDALIYIRRYALKDAKLKVIGQTRFCGNLVTLFEQGGVQLSCEGEAFNIYDLDDGFAAARFSENAIAGFPVLCISGVNRLAILSHKGKLVYMNAAENYVTGNTLKTSVRFQTCAAAVADCEFSYDGEEMKLVKSVTKETEKADGEIMHFAFFECVMTRGDFAKYLSDDLKEKADAIFSFLGEFIDVTVPTQKFYSLHGDLRAAGLVYPLKKNLFEVRYYAVDVDGGKINNIYEVE